MSGTRSGKEEPRHLLEKVGDAAVVQCRCDSFGALPVKARVLAWHLTQAAIAGRPIYFDQKTRGGTELLALLEEVYLKRSAFSDATARAVETYVKRFWINNGPYHAVTSKKETLPLDRATWTDAVNLAVSLGARLPLRSGESVDALLRRHDATLFDPTYRPMLTAKSPEPGVDVLEASACTFYGDGVTTRTLVDFDEKYALNSDVEMGPDGRPIEIPWRAGDAARGIPPGRYAEPLSKVIDHLEAALPWAEPPTRRALEALIRFHKSGEEADRIAYDVAWVEDATPLVDTVNGFIEVYVDPRGRKGSWEGIVSVEDPVKAGRLKAIAESARWFEERMPFDPAYRKPEVTGVSARSIDVLIETGDSGPVTPIGINLPNDQAVREIHGSKSVSLANICEAYERSAVASARREWCFDDAEYARAEAYGRLANELHTDLHEIIGHGSGRQAPDRAGDPAKWLREYASTIEEARADLVALWFLADPRMKELGLVDDVDAVARAGYESYARNGAITQLRRVKSGDRLEEDHMRNRQMIVRWILAESSALAEVERDGKRFVVLSDPAAFREAVGRLLRDVQRVKSEGDFEGAKHLVETWGVRFDPALRDEVVARWEKHDSTTYTGFVFPRLVPIRDASGAVVDASITYPISLEDQMLEWSGRRLYGATP